MNAMENSKNVGMLERLFAIDSLTLYNKVEVKPVLSFIYNNIKSLDPLRAKKTFIRKKLGHTAVSVILTSSMTL